jgi:hypothetical protein
MSLDRIVTKNSKEYHFQLMKDSSSFMQQQIETGLVIQSVQPARIFFDLYGRRHDTVSNGGATTTTKQKDRQFFLFLHTRLKKLRIFL